MPRRGYLHLFDPETNPMLAREWCRYRRRWLPLALLLLVGWIPAAWLLRIRLQGMFLLGASPVGDLVVGSTLFWMRPDLLTGIFLTYQAFRQEEWESLRRDIALTPLTAAQILAGKCAIPVAVGVLLNITSMPFYYESLADPRTSYVSIGPIDLWVGGLILLFALFEDLLFSTMVVLMAVREFLAGADPLQAVTRSLAAIILRGTLVGLLAALSGQIYYLVLLGLDAIGASTVDFMTRNPGWDNLCSNTLFMLVVLNAEWAILRRVISYLRRRIPDYLSEEPGSGDPDVPSLRSAA